MAVRIREALIPAFPEIEDHYTVIGGLLPEALGDGAWTGPSVTLLFTNVANGWSEATIDGAIEFFQRVGDVNLSVRLFGTIRDKSDQQALFSRIAAIAITAEWLPAISQNMEFARFTFSGRPTGRS